jgi:hypothetical protein
VVGHHCCPWDQKEWLLRPRTVSGYNWIVSVSRSPRQFYEWFIRVRGSAQKRTLSTLGSRRCGTGPSFDHGARAPQTLLALDPCRVMKLIPISLAPPHVPMDQRSAALCQLSAESHCRNFLSSRGDTQWSANSSSSGRPFLLTDNGAATDIRCARCWSILALKRE